MRHIRKTRCQHRVPRHGIMVERSTLSLQTPEMLQIIDVSGREEGVNAWQLLSGLWMVYRPPLSRSSFC
eukprot:scaffold212609_cov66-Cyclotella_meneghiniana.AAC.1